MITVNNVVKEVKTLLISQGQEESIEKVNDISYLVCSHLVEIGRDIQGEFAVWCSGPMLESLAFDAVDEDDIMIHDDTVEEIRDAYDEVMKRSYSDAEFSLLTSLYDEAWNRSYAENRTYIPWSYVQ